MSLRIGSASSRSSRGFTLIETMIVVGIAGVLSSIAYPSFTAHIQRARRSDAMVALMQVQLAQERFRSSNPSYGSLADLGLPSSSMSGHYSL
ncbi:MAG: prepilin-type N-terminal cleavage/methylation domain-containing protein, partial [Pseudomonadota bacterium]|nr:prepilin-type N-terminal cleavage/methylation domain-containing protein [Pseudomonadota bacterium]